MSHFTVLVVGENVEGQLAPYQENNNGDCPKEYLEFAIEVPKDRVKEYVRWSLRTMKGTDKLKYSKMTDEQFMKNYAGFFPNENGDYGLMINPDSKWDWWGIGGRWRGYLMLKPDRKGKLAPLSRFEKEDRRYWPNGVDIARKGDVDFKGMKRVGMKEARENWKKFASESDKEKKKRIAFDYDIGLGDTEEKRIRRAGCTATFAVLKDGQWHEKGQMGPWGMADNKKEDEAWQKEFEKLLKGLPDDTLLTVVDCHT